MINIKLMTTMWHNFAEYILNECETREVKIAEIGVGKFSQIADILNEHENITIIKTDISPADATVIKDDITNPDMKLYEGTDIIYSVRPPSELQPYIADLSKKTGSLLIIKPLTNEDLNTGRVKMKLKNYKKASFYISG